MCQFIDKIHRRTVVLTKLAVSELKQCKVQGYFFSPALFIVMPTEIEEPVQANRDPAAHLPQDTHFSYLCIQ